MQAASLGDAMTSDELDTICLSMVGTEKVIQWKGAHVYKVGGKVFAIYSPEADRLTLKCASPEVAEMLIEVGAAIRAPHLPRGGWVAMRDLEGDELRERLETSLETVMASLPKNVQAELANLKEVK